MYDVFARLADEGGVEALNGFRPKENVLPAARREKTD